MARFILIENHSGFIFGDTADLPAFLGTDRTPVDAARALDESIGVCDRLYEELNRCESSGQDGYHVYRADLCGSEQVSNITDGQDQEMIEAVERDCQYVGFVRAFRVEF